MTEVVEDITLVENTKTLNESIERYDKLLLDPGNHPAEHFKQEMFPIRFKIRQYLSQFTDNQSDYLSEWQEKNMTPFKDIFYPYTANLGAHTFYVIFLPIPVWFGYYELTRDLVYILAYSIYVTGFFKDFCCLPRPKSPPVKRNTLSHYTTKEYGAPSSHSASATGSSLYFIYCIWNCSDFSDFNKITLTMIALIYLYIIVVGRIYCGMHGILDISAGILCGLLCFSVRILVSFIFQDFVSSNYWWYPILCFAFGLFLLFKHVRPIDECPCFADSVAFIGVVSGFECADWLKQIFYANLNITKISEAGNVAFLRPLVGVTVILFWKSVISKPLIYGFLLKVLRLPDDRMSIAKRKKLMMKPNECSLHVGEPNIEIVGRYLIYMGIPFITIIPVAGVFKFLGMW